MCGILGDIKRYGEIKPELFEQMLLTLEHRGPDGEGIYISKDRKKALGHRRLSFLDLSEKGKQPFCNPSQDIWISFNGEIYNYKELREELKQTYPFNTESDTEVIVAAYQQWGIDFIQKLKGMFAISILDEKKNKLFLIRDRFGIKPLYYGNTGKDFIFASELKAIMESGVFPKKLNKSAIADFFVYRYIPSPKSIWEGISKLPPATYLSLDLSTFKHQTKEYWHINHSSTQKSVKSTVEETKQILLQSVKEHLRADVPIGSFLSGGYDSSALVCWMKNNGLKPTTFSIGFTNWDKSEDYFAKVVSDHLNVPNKATVVSSNSINLIDIMPTVFDEPIADISIIPTYLVSQLAKKDVKAVFSGEGADEIFGGYSWQHDYYNLINNNTTLQRIKNFIKPIDTVNFYARAMAMGWFDDKELKQMLHPDLHENIPEDVHWFYRQNYNSELSPLKSIQFMDIKCFMGELVLTKIDRASMSNSLEVRVPFLDHKLYERMFSLNEKVYFSPVQTKKILFENIKNCLPDEILKRKKQGFVGPDQYYMNLDYYRNELKDAQIVKHHIIQQKYLDKLLKESYNWKLWKILVLEKWFKYWMT